MATYKFIDIPIQEHWKYNLGTVPSVEDLNYKRNLRKPKEFIESLLFNTGFSTRGDILRKYKKEVEWVVFNVVITLRRKASYVSYSRDRNHYTGRGVGYVKLNKILSHLARLNYIDLYIGVDYIYSGMYSLGGGMLSRISFSEHLLDAILPMVEGSLHRVRIGGRVIVNNRREDSPIGVMSTEGLSLYKDKVEEYNKFLEQFDIKYKGQPVPIQQYNKIFKYNLKSGGRWYADGGGTQVMPKEERKLLTIEGSSVAELDYVAMHPSLLYQMEVANQGYAVTEHTKRMEREYGVPFDMYYDGDIIRTVEGMAEEFYRKWGKKLDVPRNMMKKLFLIAINSKKVSTGTWEMTDAIRKDYMLWGTEEEYKSEFYGADLVIVQKLVEHLVHYHLPIQSYLFADNGLFLQHLDSQIMDNILTMAIQRGIPVLPIHDGVVCKTEDVDMCEYIMEAAWREEFSSTSFCKIKREY